MHLGIVPALKHYPVTLSSKPSPQAKQILPVGSHSLQLSGQAAVSARSRRSKAGALIIDLLFII